MSIIPNPTTPPNKPKIHWRKQFFIGTLILISILLVARVLAPTFVRRAINRRLSSIPDYSGKVEAIRLHIWRGAYTIKNISIIQKSGKVKDPFFAADRVDFSIAWKEIFHGKLVSQIYITNGQLNFLKGPDDSSSQLTTDKRWQDAINDIFPIDITILDIKGGVLRFIDTTQTPKVDIAIRELNVRATGLRNRPSQKNAIYPAQIDISGTTIGDGRLKIFAKVEPLAIQPHFEVALEVRDLSLPALNDFLKAYANVDVSKGRFDAVAQMAMGQGHYEGYVKPFIAELDIRDDEKKSLGDRIWRVAVAGVANLAKNKDTHQIATRIPFSGETNRLDIHTWKTIENALHHGFVRALGPGFEGTTHPDGAKADSPKMNAPDEAPERSK